MPQDPPLEWHYWREPRQDSPVIAEFRALFDGLTEAWRVHIYAAISQRMTAAAAGDLFTGDDDSGPALKPVSRDPDLWEVRWELTMPQPAEPAEPPTPVTPHTLPRAGIQHWRMYHAEPGQAPGFLIALRFHRKVIEGNDDEIRDAQNAEIDVAARRYNDGRPTLWGLP